MLWAPVLLSLLQYAVAGDLRAPFELEQAAVLPAHVGNPRYKTFTMTVDSKWNASGIAEPLGQKLNKSVTWNDLIDGQPTANGKATVAGLIQQLQSQGALPLEGGPGQTTGLVSSSAWVSVPVLAFGVTERWTVAAAVPVVSIKANVDTGFVVNSSGQRFVKGVSLASGPVKASEAVTKLSDAVNQKLVRLGYQPVTSTSVTGLGDVKLVNKFSALHDEVHSLALRAEVTLPTGIGPHVDHALDLPTGDGQTDLGVGIVYERELLKDFKWTTFGGWTWQIADQIERRIPTSASDSLSANKEWVMRDLGDQLTLGTGVTYRVPWLGLSFCGGYSFQHQLATHFAGSQYAAENYRWLEADYASQTLHSGLVGVGFSTVEWYRGGKFVYPFQANLTYSVPLAGYNVTRNEVLAAEIVLFF